MKGLSKRYGATMALEGVDLELHAGELHALLGENGAGKSTLMKLLSGAESPDAGEMRLDGEIYSPRDPHEGRARGVAMIYQELSLAPDLSVAENLGLGRERVRGIRLDLRAEREIALETLKRLGLNNVLPEDECGSLSMAEQQMVEIGRALLGGCRVLVLDEPTSSLGGAEKLRLFALIRELASGGVAVCYISHFLEEVRELASRYTVLRDGKWIASGLCADSDNTQLVAWMAGRKVEEFYHKSARTPGALDFEFEGLKLRKGEVFGIAGLLGSGRSRLLRRIMGLEGSVAEPWRRWREGVGFVSEDRKGEGLAQELSVAENLCLAGARSAWADPAELDLRAVRGIEALGIKCSGPRQEIQNLSGGNQQKVAMARLLDADCHVLLLDEPTRGIDVGAKAEIYKWIDQLAAQGKVVLMVSSYLPDLLGACDRIAVMRKGALGPARPVAQCSEHSLLMEACGA